ncbi:hypothetical protein GWI33_013364 [Rhynchophorus ferrugineus]|uniref:Uncharacterized protein n=1 Tax=Rhynchophorus ferrugineus TaxID=354439 RepID=A0A834MA10_RHYFE|nr:hypothetical protein GWI33_013364 [Rhynchophorus ferrugineus]
MFKKLIFASVLRYIVMTSKYQTTIANHVEVSTPMNAWKRVLEGLFLMSKNVDPYTGDLLHETPSALMFYKVMMNTFYSNINLMFIVFDIATGLFLYAAIGRYANLFQEEHKDRKKYPEDVQEYLPDKKHSRNVSLYVLMAYLFNPYSLLGCVGHSTTGIHNFFLAVFIYGMFHGYAIGFVVAVILLMTSCLAPILWHLWIYSASANANFYFGVTLAYAIAQIFLVTDILFAHTKWEFALRHGKQAKIDGKDANLSLE